MQIFDGRWNAELGRWECEICGGTTFKVMEHTARDWVLESVANGDWELVRIDPWEGSGHYSDVYCPTCGDLDHYLNGSGQLTDVDLELPGTSATSSTARPDSSRSP